LASLWNQESDSQAFTIADDESFSSQPWSKRMLLFRASGGTEEQIFERCFEKWML
jgi:hypothetical protein